MRFDRSTSLTQTSFAVRQQTRSIESSTTRHVILHETPVQILATHDRVGHPHRAVDRLDDLSHGEQQRRPAFGGEMSSAPGQPPIPVMRADSRYEGSMTSPPPWGPPPYPHPPRPVPSKSPLPWIIGAVSIIAAVGLVAGLGIYGVRKLLSAPEREFTVVLEVAGSASSAHVTQSWPGHPQIKGDFERWPTVTLPWRQEVTFTAPVDQPAWVDLEAFAATHQGGVVCRISIAGHTITDDLSGDIGAHCRGDAGKPGPPTAPTLAATPPPIPAGPPPHSDIIPVLALPAGSTASSYGPGDREWWSMPITYPDAVRHLRTQLPINAPLQGLPWCYEHVENNLTLWTWATPQDMISVMVDGDVTKGSDVSITRKPPATADPCS